MAKLIYFNRCRYIGMGEGAAIGAAVSAGGSIISGPLTAYLQHKYAAEDRAENYRYNEMAAENADARERAQWRDMYSMEAQLRQIRENGLSPSLMMSGGVPGTQGASGHQGQGGAGPSTGPISPLFDMSAFANLGPAMAQIKVAESQSNLNNAEADRIRGNNQRGQAEILKIMSEAGLNDAVIALTKSQQTGQDIANYVNDSKKEYDVSKAYSESNYWAYQSSIASYHVISAEAAANVDWASQQDKIDRVRKENSLIDSDILVNKSIKALNDAKVNLTNEEINKIKKELLLYEREVVVKETLAFIEQQKVNIQSKQQDSYDNYVKAYKDFCEGQVKNLENRLNFDKSKWPDQKKMLFTHTIGGVVTNSINSVSNVIDACVPF